MALAICVVVSTPYVSGPLSSARWINGESFISFLSVQLSQEKKVWLVGLGYEKSVVTIKFPRLLLL